MRRKAYILIHYKNGDISPIQLSSFTSYGLTLKELDRILMATAQFSPNITINPVTHLTGVIR